MVFNRLFVGIFLMCSAPVSVHALYKEPIPFTSEQEAQLCFDVLMHKTAEDGRTNFMHVVLNSKDEVVVGVCKAMQEKLRAEQIFQIFSASDKKGCTALVLAVAYGRAKAIDAMCQVMLNLSYDQKVEVLSARGPVGVEPNEATVKALERLFLDCGVWFLVY